VKETVPVPKACEVKRGVHSIHKMQRTDNSNL